jgi:hypothetical protein
MLSIYINNPKTVLCPENVSNVPHDSYINQLLLVIQMHWIMWGRNLKLKPYLDELQAPEAKWWLRQPVTNHVELGVDKAALRPAFLQAHRLSLSLTYHQYSKLICTCKTCLNKSIYSSSLRTFQQIIFKLHTRWASGIKHFSQVSKDNFFFTGFQTWLWELHYTNPHSQMHTHTTHWSSN